MLLFLKQATALVLSTSDFQTKETLELVLGPETLEESLAKSHDLTDGKSKSQDYLSILDYPDLLCTEAMTRI